MKAVRQTGPNGARLAAGQPEEGVRRPFTFLLEEGLVQRAKVEIGEPEMVRSIEAALEAAIDYQLWVREVAAGERDVLS